MVALLMLTLECRCDCVTHAASWAPLLARYCYVRVVVRQPSSTGDSSSGTGAADGNTPIDALVASIRITE